MYSVIFIRHDLPEEKMLFPSAREKKKKTEKIFLPVYAVPVILEARRTNVRDTSPPKSWGWKRMDNREELEKIVVQLVMRADKAALRKVLEELEKTENNE